jgi:hypothetical protein
VLHHKQHSYQELKRERRKRKEEIKARRNKQLHTCKNRNKKVNKMAKNKNNYKKAALRKELSGTGDGSTGEKARDAAVELGKDIAIGVIGGGVAGAALGRLSFLVGAAVSGVGHFAKNRIAAALGLGMMASGTYQTVSGMNGKPPEGLEGVKERLLALKEDMKKRIFLDKVLKAKKPTAAAADTKTTNGLGDVQYFAYPNTEETVGELDMTSLDNIHQAIQDSAMKQMSGTEEYLNGEEEIGAVDTADKIY